MIVQPPKVKSKKKLYEYIAKLGKLKSGEELEKIQNKYLYWDKVKDRKYSYSAEDMWYCMKLDRLLRGYKFSFGKYDFSFMLTDFMQRALYEFDLHLHGTEFHSLSIAEAEKGNLIVHTLAEEAIASSQLAGAEVLSAEAKELLLQGGNPKNRQEQMAMNNFYVLQYLGELKNADCSDTELLKIHGMICANTLDNEEEAGRFRNADDLLNASLHANAMVYNPVQYREIDGLIEVLCRFFNQEEKGGFIHPVVKASIIHYLVNWIRPFPQANGRMARVLFYWYLLKKGYGGVELLSISKIIQKSKNQYARAHLYTEADGGDVGYFITYQLRTLEKAMEVLKLDIRKKEKALLQASVFMQIPNVNDRMAQIIKAVHDDSSKVFTAKEVELEFNISANTSRADLKALVELGFLEMVPINRNKFSFVRAKNFKQVLKGYNVLQ